MACRHCRNPAERQHKTGCSDPSDPDRKKKANFVAPGKSEDQDTPEHVGNEVNGSDVCPRVRDSFYKGNGRPDRHNWCGNGQDQVKIGLGVGLGFGLRRTFNNTIYAAKESRLKCGKSEGFHDEGPLVRELQRRVMCTS